MAWGSFDMLGGAWKAGRGRGERKKGGRREDVVTSIFLHCIGALGYLYTNIFSFFFVRVVYLAV
jgi:hypothetical protein